ncbi:DUF6401 family natural product biosynthesis protein [Nonomuraea pusilla]|uniref:Uncharacterized protein n=1 Tax=Nonomuraea pusilla TaxID=46177 RepID=A0A1H7KMM8_9ACTN|nr:DUF6401 family natural product biosynthesis protein [Nonomuraea pusilla]SEK88091.1 hypothetical protein SAMN05660976_01308 [Nonomuraea pusilla]
MSNLGRAQLARMASDPGLVAAVDQHAAVVRDSIPLDRETLGDYLLGFLDELRHRGWSCADRLDELDELEELDAPALRLTAVCWLARELGFLEDELPA